MNLENMRYPWNVLTFTHLRNALKEGSQQLSSAQALGLEWGWLTVQNGVRGADGQVWG